MSCNCKDSYKRLETRIEELEKGVKQANTEDGPYWGRILIEDFCNEIYREEKVVDCNCSFATKLNKAIKHIKGNNDIGNSSGSFQDRNNLDLKYKQFKDLLLS